jgi:hypothetical protein
MFHATPRDAKAARAAEKSSAQGGSSSMVEHQFSKLITRVRFPPSAPLRCKFWNDRPDADPLAAFTDDRWDTPIFAHVAQSVEHFLGKEEVTGSIPVMSTISFTRRGLFLGGVVSFNSLSPSGFNAHGKG